MRLCRAGAAPLRSGVEVWVSLPPAPSPPPRRAPVSAPTDGLRLEQRRGAAAPPAAAATAAATAAAGAGGGPGGAGGSAGAGAAAGAVGGPRLRAAVAGAAALLAAGLRAGPGVEHLGPYPELGPPGLRLQRLGHRPARLLGAHRLRALFLLHVAHGQEGLIHGGQLLNGLAGPTVMNAAPFLSTTWFSPDERATATAIASLLNYLGAAGAFLVGPLVVPSPNGTSHLLLVSQSNTEHIKDRIEAVLYAEFGMVSLIFSAALAYFPSRPPFPPSVAAASQRLSYRRSFCRLLSNFRFLMIALAYAIPLGVFSGWSGVLDLILTPVHVSQVDAGWIGFWSIVGGCVVGIAMARFADFIRGMLKFILLLLLSGATLASTWFTLTCLTSVTHLPLTTATLYTSCILLGIFLNSSVPIFFELFVETVYPVPEGITCGVVTFLSNVFMGVLLFFLTFYHTEFSWFNWCLPGSCLLSLLLILCFRESYDRLYLDVVVSV
ncbi:solute carrier family 49 member 4 isoform X1 [Grus americana]|uniref:solute carrier family 49 member 4 isoform X1 n=1 Tax=Grus americana TaxID=9117 RepID=UPI002407FF4F|nr:solute carrier family 49 member 4 isoform X1 [Grus americana]